MQEKNQTVDTQELSKMILLHSGKQEVNAELNRLYSLYRKPLSDAEKLKISNIIVDYLRNFDVKFAESTSSVLCLEQDFIKTLCDIKKMCNDDKHLRKKLKNKIVTSLKDINFARTLLQKSRNAEQYNAKCELIAHAILTRPIG